MDKRHINVLKKSRIALLDINPADNVLDYLLQESVFSQDEADEISAQNTPKKQATILLNKLPKKGKRAFSTFIDGLLDSESEAHHDLAETLKQNAAEVGASITDGAPASAVPASAGSASVAAASASAAAAMPSSSWPELVSAKQVDLIAANASGADQEDYDLLYMMTHKPRGLALIVNNRNFTCGMKDRQGSDVDAKALEGVYTKIGFVAHALTNVTGQQLRDNLYSLAKHDHRNYDAVIVTILSHGVEGKIYGTDGDLVDVSQVTSYFRGDIATSLAGKPKIFILQACRGGTFDGGFEATDGPEAGRDSDVSAAGRETDAELFQRFLDSVPANSSMRDDETDGHLGSLPVEADMIIAYATVPGYVSWRNSERGSWFIQALVKVLTERGNTEHLMDMLTMVNNLVATEFQSKGRQKQMPAPVSHLRKKLYFR